MNAVQQWTAGICLAVLAGSLLQHLMPEGAMRRMAELTAGAFFLCAVLVPLMRAAPDFSILLSLRPSTVEEEFAGTVQRQQEQAIRDSVTSLIAAQLSQEGIPVQGIEVDVNMGEDGSIHMNQITVTLPAEYAGACFRASSILSSVLGLEAEVTANAGEQEAQ